MRIFPNLSVSVIDFKISQRCLPKTPVSWCMAPRRLASMSRHFRGPCCLRRQRQAVQDERLLDPEEEGGRYSLNAQHNVGEDWRNVLFQHAMRLVNRVGLPISRSSVEPGTTQHVRCSCVHVLKWYIFFLHKAFGTDVNKKNYKWTSGEGGEMEAKHWLILKGYCL